MKKLKTTAFLALLMAMGPGAAVSEIIDLQLPKEQTFSDRANQIEYYIETNLADEDVDMILKSYALGSGQNENDMGGSTQEFEPER